MSQEQAVRDGGRRRGEWVWTPWAIRAPLQDTGVGGRHWRRHPPVAGEEATDSKEARAGKRTGTA